VAVVRVFDPGHDAARITGAHAAAHHVLDGTEGTDERTAARGVDSGEARIEEALQVTGFKRRHGRHIQRGYADHAEVRFCE